MMLLYKDTFCYGIVGNIMFLDCKKCIISGEMFTDILMQAKPPSILLLTQVSNVSNCAVGTIKIKGY